MINTLTGITVHFDEQLKIGLDAALAKIADPNVRAILEPMLGLMTTTGADVLKAASRLALELQWPEDVSFLSRLKIDAQLKEQMQSQILDTMQAQLAALIQFQMQTAGLVVQLMIDQMAARAPGASKLSH